MQNRVEKYLFRAFTMTIFIMLSACAATSHEITESVNHAPAGYQIQKLVVVAITEDGPTRSKFEDGFASAMSNHGLSTNASYKAMPDLDDLADDQKLEKAKSETSADTSLMVEVVEVNAPAKATKNAMFGVWIAGVLLDDDDVRRVGAWGGLAASDAGSNYKLRVTVWNMDDNSLLWTGDTISYVYDLASDEKSGAILADTIHEELLKSGLIK